jgi:hypothetical protein
VGVEIAKGDGRSAEYRAVRRSYRSFTRSAGLLGEEYTARRFRTVEVGCV